MVKFGRFDLIIKNWKALKSGFCFSGGRRLERLSRLIKVILLVCCFELLCCVAVLDIMGHEGGQQPNHVLKLYL